MTDKERAEEYVTRECCTTCKNINHFCKEKCECWTFAKKAFLAGLKAGRPQWHKVADKDLLTVGRRFLVSNRYCTMIGYWNGETFVSADEDTAEIANPIAWCEIPTYTDRD